MDQCLSPADGQGLRVIRYRRTAVEQNLIWPVTLTVVNGGLGDVPDLPIGVVVREADQIPDMHGWDWYPRHLPHYGLAPEESDTPRIWFAGVPEGQERTVFETLIMTMGRRQRLLSPLTESAADRIDWPLSAAVLTTPG